MSIRFTGVLRRSRRTVFATAVLGALASTGCGPGVQDGESQVWGRVTVQGKPVPGGSVVFMPMAERDVTWGAGPLDGEGRFRLSCSRVDIPLRPGRYAVYFRAPVKVDREAGKLVDDPDYPVPARYLDPAAPAIHLEIKDEPTKLDFNLDE